MPGSVFRIATAPYPKLKEPPAPSLEGLRVRVAKPANPTSEELLERLDQLRWEAAERLPRPTGSPVQANDAVLVDVLAYSGGHVVPFSAQEGRTLVLDEASLQDPVLAGLLGTPTGSQVQIAGTLPPDHSAPEFAGRPAVYAIDVKAAWERRERAPEDPALLSILGLGASPDIAMVTIRTLLERERADDQEREVIFKMMEELVRRAPVQVPRSALEKEIYQRWSQQEGRFLQRIGISASEHDACLDAWLKDPDILADVKKGVQHALILRSIARKLDVKLSPDELIRQAIELGTQAGIPAPAKPDHAFANDPAARTQVFNQLGYLNVVYLVRERVQVEVT